MLLKFLNFTEFIKVYYNNGSKTKFTTMTLDIDIENPISPSPSPPGKYTYARSHYNANQPTCPDHHDSGDVFNVKHSGGRERDTRTYWFETCSSIDEKACGKWVQSLTQKTPGCSSSPPSSFNTSPPLLLLLPLPLTEMHCGGSRCHSTSAGPARTQTEP